MSPSQTSRTSLSRGPKTTRANFTETRWSKLFAARIAASTERCSILDFLIRRYWKPVYCYLRRSGCGEEDARDYVQEFFAACLRNQGEVESWELRVESPPPRLGTGDSQLSTLNSQLSSKGFAFIDDSAFAGEHPGALQHPETPDEIFHRTWLQELVLRVLKRLDRACHAAGQDTHYELFRRHLVAPALEGVDAPPLRELGAAAGLTAKDAANRILTVQRAFQRLLKEEIRLDAASDEEAAEELRDLKRFLARRECRAALQTDLIAAH